MSGNDKAVARPTWLGLTPEGAAIGGAIGGGVGGVIGGLIGGGGGTLVAPGVGTIGGGIAGAGEGAVSGADIGAGIGDAVSNIYKMCTDDDDDEYDNCILGCLATLKADNALCELMYPNGGKDPKYLECTSRAFAKYHLCEIDCDVKHPN